MSCTRASPTWRARTQPALSWALPFRSSWPAGLTACGPGSPAPPWHPCWPRLPRPIGPLALAWPAAWMAVSRQPVDQGVINLNKLVGASVWEERLYEHLTTHELKEREVLVEYQDAAAATKSAAFAYLADLIVDDEIRHHQIFRDLAAALKTDAE